MMNANGPSLADIAAVTGNNRSNDSGWGGDGGWWVLIILFALFGWGGNGAWGGRGGSSGESTSTASTDAAIQRGFDNQSVINKLNGLENGLCDGFYSMNTTMLQGFNGVTNAMQQGNFGLQQAINDVNVGAMQNANAIQSQLQQCCCENREAIAQVRYDMATNTCAINNAIQTQTRDIIDNQNANYRAIHDELIQSQIEAKNDKIAEQASLIQSLNLAQSQANQNQYLINQLRPSPVPAFAVPSPFTSYFGMGYGNNGCCTANV